MPGIWNGFECIAFHSVSDKIGGDIINKT